MLHRYLFSHLKYYEKHIFLWYWSFYRDWQIRLGMRLCLHHCFPTILEIWKQALRQSLQFPWMSSWILRNRVAIWLVEECWVLCTVKSSPPGHLDWYTLGPMSSCFGLSTHRFGAYVSTKTVGKQWPFQVPKLFCEIMKTYQPKDFVYMLTDRKIS